MFFAILLRPSSEKKKKKIPFHFFILKKEEKKIFSFSYSSSVQDISVSKYLHKKCSNLLFLVRRKKNIFYYYYLEEKKKNFISQFWKTPQRSRQRKKASSFSIL